VFGLVVLLTAGMLQLPTRTTSKLKLALSSLFLPLFGVASSAHHLTQKAGTSVVSRQDLLRQIQHVEQENQQLRLRAVHWDTVAQENARLREYLSWQKQSAWKLKLARVVGRDPANWWRTLRIDAGSLDGITTNAPVFTAGGLVGRVAEVGFKQSQVVLVGDPDCRVSVLIEETRDHGVIAAASSSPLDPTLVDLVYLPRNSQLRAGQKVVTSGEGGIFPKNIVVGQLVDFRSVDYGLYNEARVKLAVRMNTLEEVWVKLP
jgi:rod shape-determining protein MreC